MTDNYIVDGPLKETLFKNLFDPLQLPAPYTLEEFADIYRGYIALTVSVIGDTPVFGTGATYGYFLTRNDKPKLERVIEAYRGNPYYKPSKPLPDLSEVVAEIKESKWRLNEYADRDHTGTIGHVFDIDDLMLAYGIPTKRQAFEKKREEEIKSNEENRVREYGIFGRIFNVLWKEYVYPHNSRYSIHELD